VAMEQSMSRRAVDDRQSSAISEGREGRCL
jgi:hypothetical protein